MKRRHGPQPSASFVAEAIARFLDEGGLIVHLPAAPTPMRSALLDDADRYALAEVLYHEGVLHTTRPWEVV